MTLSSVGFIGLGLMGRPMAGRLLKAGFPVTVFNRSRPAMEALAAEGAGLAESPAHVGRTRKSSSPCCPMPPTWKACSTVTRV